MNGDSLILNFFGGVSRDGSSWAVDFDMVLYELARWLLFIGICLLAQGVWFEKWRKIEPLACYRYTTIKIWWRWKFFRSLLNGVLAAAVLFIAVIVTDIINIGGFSDEGWKVFILWFVHIITIITFFLVLDLTRLRKLAPAILLLLEGITFLVGFLNMKISWFMYGMWGMYFQSRWYYGETGVSVLSSLITEGILIILSYLIGGILLKRTAQK